MTPEAWKRVKALAIEAWEQPAAERIRYVTAASAGDEALKREVLSLVTAMVDAEGRFEVPATVPDDHAPAAILTGRRIGAYEVLARIGEGGMGEVYKARDTRLDRIVALKVLPARASTDPASRERMAREARAAAALSHPHICTIYDIGSQDGIDYLVMEFVDGETLSTRLAHGEVPVAEALRYAEQIATALGEAHRAGFVHRDVKPANIMLHAPASGVTQAKLLDFGVAKANAPEPTPILQHALNDAPVDLTIAGSIIGTPYYMAPEQLDRNATDRRTDIFAFGAVLFEMLTGRKAFAGTNRHDVLDAVRSGNVPRPSSLRERLPTSLDRVVMRCLAPKPSERYQSAEELIVDLRGVQHRLESSRRWRVMMAGAAVLLVAIGGPIAWTVSAPETVATPRLEPSVVRLPASAGVIGAPALSPDGSNLVFLWAGEGVDNPELMLLPTGSTTKRRLTNDPGVEELPTWSPDGKEVAFIRCDSSTCGIFALRIQDGGKRKLHDLRRDRYFGLEWSPDGRSIVYSERASIYEPYALTELSLHDSSTRRLTSPVSGQGDLRLAFSPDGATLALIRVKDQGIGVHLLALDTRAEKVLIDGQQEWFGGVTWSSDGRQLILSANQQGVRRLWKLPVMGGRLEPLIVAGEDSYYPSVEGSRLVFVRSFRDWDFSRATIVNGKLQAAVPFPSSTRPDLDPAFSPDGRRLAFISERGGARELWVSDADGSNPSQLTSLQTSGVSRPSWSPNGQQIAFDGTGINVIFSNGGSSRRLFADGERPTWSPDGQWIYFVRTRGEFKLWKVPAAGGTAEQVFTGEAYSAREAAQGRHLYFVRTDGIWRRSLSGSEETRIIPGFIRSLSGYWAVVDDGIYYVFRELLPNNSYVHHLKFYDFARGRSTHLGTLTGNIEDWVGGLTVSADRRTILYSHRTYESNEIVLVEHFR